MKTVYIVEELAYSYDDEWYSRGGGGEAIDVYQSKANAEAECARLNTLAREEERYEGEEGFPDEYYRVREVRVADVDVAGYAEARERVEAAQKDLLLSVRSEFDAGAVALFDAHPSLESFGWPQYRNYWNDGDECRFYPRTDEPYVNGEQTCDMEDGERYCYDSKKYVPTGRPRDPRLDLADPVRGFLGRFRSTDMLSMFGDHVMVTVTRPGEVSVDDHTDHS